ncbi:MAG: hypothetical protein K5870_00965 [Lachnospiraceae bacterium]|nr:hypothetical protein [Lachnospiraceae bacterium]
MDSEIYLLQSEFSKNSFGAFSDAPEPVKTLCRVESVSSAEIMIAGQNGLTPEYRFIVNAAEYHDERYLQYLGKSFFIYRTYRKTDTDEIELYVAERTGSA